MAGSAWQTDVPKIKLGGLRVAPTKRTYPEVVASMTPCETGVLLSNVCWTRCSAKAALYMVEGRGYWFPHSQIHADSEIFYKVNDYSMNIKPKVSATVAITVWLAQRLAEEKPALATLFDGLDLTQQDPDSDPFNEAWYYDTF